MRTWFADKKRQYLLVIAVALVAALMAELLVFVLQPRVVQSQDATSLLNHEAVTLSPYGYTINGSEYRQVEGDPQLVFSNINQTFDHVLVSFAKPIYGKLYIQLYYHEPGSNFTAECATKQMRMPFGSSHMVLQIPKGQYEGLRVDIDGAFMLSDITVSAEPIRVTRGFSNAFSFARFAVMFAVTALMGCALLWWFHKPKTATKLSAYELLFVAACFVFYTLWAVAKPLNYAPDELMRFEVTQFFFTHNHLPVGDELISQPWGFSYAHFPTMLCNQLGYLFMKAASLFVTGDFKLLIAARMVSVCCCTGVVYYVTKASKLLLRSPARFIMIAFVALMPQFAFLASYVNNDTPALLGVAMIVYAWTLAVEFNWDWKSALLQAVGVAICGLSYYNSYPWILLSIVFFVVSYYYQNRKDHKGFMKLLGFIVVVVVVLIGYSFIRHLVLYGDLLGFKTRRYYGELYGVHSLKPSITQSLSERGVPFMTMLFDPPYEYLKKTWESFVGVFSYMSVFCPAGIYKGVFGGVCVAVAGLVLRAGTDIAKKQRPRPMKVLMVIAMILSGLIAIGLAVRMSYTSDFQAQGRYCYPALITFAFLVAKGYEALLALFKRREVQYALTAMLCTSLAAVSWFAYTMVYLPS